MPGDTRPETVTILSDAHQLYGKLWEVDGTSPTVLLLCGLGFHTFEYDLLAPLLANAGYNCLSFDYRGHGRNEGKRGDWTLRDLADDARSALDLIRSRHHGKIGVFGNSLGAMTGILAATQDERISSVVASNCPARLADFMLTPLRTVLYRAAKVVGLALPLRISVNHFYAYEQLIADARWLETIRSDARITEARRLSLAAYQSLLEEWDAATMVEKLGKPLLIVQGRNDALQPVSESERIYEAAKPPRELALLDTGHLPNLEAPEALGRLLSDWFAKTLD